MGYILLLVVFTATMVGCSGTESGTMPSKEPSEKTDGKQTQTQTTQPSLESPSPKSDPDRGRPTAAADGKYETHSIFSDKLEVSIPKEFKAKSNKTDEVVYTDKSEEVTITIQHDPEQRVEDQYVAQGLPKLTGILKQDYAGAKLLREEVIKVNGKPFAVGEADSKDKYVLLSWTALNGEFLEIEITSPVNKKAEWQTITNDIVKSVKMK